MPRSEARIFTSIWRDPAFLALSGGAQRLYMFLLSQEDLTYCGVIPLRPPRWASKAAGLTLPELECHLKELEGTAYPKPNPDPESAGTPFVVADEDTGELLVRSLLRRDQAWKQPNLLKQAREAASQIESRRICGALLAELRRLPLGETGSDLVKTLVADFIKDLEQGEPYPSAYPPGYPTDEPSDDPSGKDYAHARELGEGNGSSTGDSPNPPSPVPPSLPAQQRTDRKRGTRLPEDFAVTAEMVAWFRENCPHVDGKAETERFRDHWRGKAGREGCKLDWVATWRNWMRTAEERAGPRARGKPSVPTTDARVQAGLDLAARYAENERQELTS
jgi:hypothetical protein